MRFYAAVTALFITVSGNLLSAAVISDVRIEQSIVVADGSYRGASSLSIIGLLAVWCGYINSHRCSQFGVAGLYF